MFAIMTETGVAVPSGSETFYSPHQGKLTAPLDPATSPDPLTEFVHDGFRALILNPRFSCVAAKGAFNRENYRFALYHGGLGSADATAELARDLYLFIVDQERLRADGFSTFVASFAGPEGLTEAEFEARLWAQLQSLHDRDAAVSEWDATVERDPNSPHFEWSYGGRAFLVVGLHPASSRFTRRFSFPTLVFNAHFQFEELRTSGKFERMQTVIRARDTALQGSINPNLANFGAASDARQYSGRAVGGEWACPFRAQGNTSDTSDTSDTTDTESEK